MKSDFICTIDNISESSDEHDNIILEEQAFRETTSDKIEEQVIPNTASAVILFKNEAHLENGKVVMDNFAPTDIQQFVVTTEPFLRLPELFARFSLSKDLLEGCVGAYVLRDGTLFLMNDSLRKLYSPILTSSLDKNGRFIECPENSNGKKA